MLIQLDNRRYIITTILLLMFALAVACSPRAGRTTPENVIALPDSSGVSVFELLKAHHEVDYDQTSSGVFVKGIDSIIGSSSAYWLYFVNDTAGTVASDKYMLQSGEKVEWRLISGF
ncbi:MAG: DUF4430 domain-containing protein [candidate division Zixibacteria bacterium]|nr:DUF4430 domain-containing protein [candidate division Zixibacteria bacterium]MBU1469669.1 DUF4430 domain-containing protein [candidate division Zixibacteria bacterium]MBU2624738.1 DUF4430 domain-containing protein [candidate division Zixibacteria bacterium]